MLLAVTAAAVAAEVQVACLASFLQVLCYIHSASPCLMDVWFFVAHPAMLMLCMHDVRTGHVEALDYSTLLCRNQAALLGGAVALCICTCAAAVL
jgi:hypothetical protein